MVTAPRTRVYDITTDIPEEHRAAYSRSARRHLLAYSLSAIAIPLGGSGLIYLLLGGGQ